MIGELAEILLSPKLTGMILKANGIGATYVSHIFSLNTISENVNLAGVCLRFGILIFGIQFGLFSAS